MKFEIVLTSHVDDNDEPRDDRVGGSLTGNTAFQFPKKHHLQIFSISYLMNGQINTTDIRDFGKWSFMIFSKWMPKEEADDLDEFTQDILMN